jgi:hypothetical protein
MAPTLVPLSLGTGVIVGAVADGSSGTLAVEDEVDVVEVDFVLPSSTN